MKATGAVWSGGVCLGPRFAARAPPRPPRGTPPPRHTPPPRSRFVFRLFVPASPRPRSLALCFSCYSLSFLSDPALRQSYLKRCHTNEPRVFTCTPESGPQLDLLTGASVSARSLAWSLARRPTPDARDANGKKAPRPSSHQCRPAAIILCPSLSLSLSIAPQLCAKQGPGQPWRPRASSARRLAPGADRGPHSRAPPSLARSPGPCASALRCVSTMRPVDPASRIYCARGRCAARG